MKKLFFISVAVFAMAFTSCGNNSKCDAEVVECDTTVVADTLVGDTLVDVLDTTNVE